MSLSEVEKLEALPRPVVAWQGDYPAGHVVPLHRHRRTQLLCALSGMAIVGAEYGRWLVPADHALWIPAGVTHSIEVVEALRTGSVYVEPDALAVPPVHSHVVRMTDLARSLIVEAVMLPPEYESASRAGLIMALILEEIQRLPDTPLGLPMPGDPRLASLCRRFIEAPSTHDTIERWAEALAMSRSAFTRFFRHQTGLSLSAWRQQACVFAALPRLAAGENVTRVAFDLGYESAAAFTTMFKRMLGAPPRRYLGHMPSGSQRIDGFASTRNA